MAAGSRDKGLVRVRSPIALTVLGLGLTALPAYAAQIDAFQLGEGAPVCRGTSGYAEDFSGRRTFLWRPQWLEAIAKDAAQKAERIEAAEAALKRGPYSVTDKPKTVPGASPNDYSSIGPYWWPDPAKRDGLPYVRRDGQVNPERSGPEFDKNRLSRLGADLEALSVGYYLTGDSRFADHAANLLRVWFLDPQTRMAPNMNFAQGIPGKVAGRGEGIIEASDLSTIVESIGLLAPSDAFNKAEQQALRQWYADFATWMATSENGEAEMQKRNNHGVFFDFYLSHFAIFAGLESVTGSIIDNFLQYRLAAQMDKQGRFLAELKRTRSWHYSNYVVGGAARLATIAECTGRDLWTAQLGDGRSLQTSRAFLQRYSDRVEDWPFPDRDHSSQRYDKMLATFAKTEMLFAGADAVSNGQDLP